MFSCDGPESPSLWPNWRPRIMAVRYLVGRGPESTGNAGTLGWAGRWRWWEYIKWTLLQAKTTMSWFFVQTGRKREANKLISALTKPKVEEALKEAKRPPKAGGASGSSGPSKNPPKYLQASSTAVEFVTIWIGHHCSLYTMQIWGQEVSLTSGGNQGHGCCGLVAWGETHSVAFVELIKFENFFTRERRWTSSWKTLLRTCEEQDEQEQGRSSPKPIPPFQRLVC